MIQSARAVLKESVNKIVDSMGPKVYPNFEEQRITKDGKKKEQDYI
jgi:hypothetical protein